MAQKKKPSTMQWEIIKLRKGRGVSRKFMAELIGCSEQTYGFKESGKHSFQAEEMYTLCKFFGVEFDDLFLPPNSIKNEVLIK